jgi:subtilisin family serine protease
MTARFAGLLASVFVGTAAVPAFAAGHPDGAAIVRILGSHARAAFTPHATTDTLSGLVRLPFGVSAPAVGLEPVVPGFGKIRGGTAAIAAFSTAHPELAVEVAPPLHRLLDQAGIWTGMAAARQAGANGEGVLVGVADTGLDVSHPDFIDANGNSRVAWILDLSAKPFGKYPDLEQKYGIVDSTGQMLGAVYQGSDLASLASQSIPLPKDEVGHGTHVTSIAAGNGGSGASASPYIGVAPDASIIFARVFADSSEDVVNANLVAGVQFIFDRADFMQKPVAVNLSLGSDFGPHDGTMAWEEVLASYVGPSMPGHALVAAAGNSGDITSSPVHESAHVAPGATTRVPITSSGTANGALEVWVAMRSGATISVGLDGPDGRWIAPIADGSEAGKNTPSYNAGVINGRSPSQSPIPSGSSGAVVVVSGAWPAGTYGITLEGEGTADLFLEGTNDVVIGGNTGFAAPVREGTINLPATNPSIIGVGCTINRLSWTSLAGATESQAEPALDPAGGAPLLDANGQPILKAISSGEVCWFSSAGPNLDGVPKPEIGAPGGVVIAAMSAQAQPGSPDSIFTTTCPPLPNGQSGGDDCMQVDSDHAVSQGTSMSAPMVAGTIALLFQRDPTLTQDRIVGLLQAGAHDFRGPHPYDDQSGPGELDVPGTLDALAASEGAEAFLPDPAASWITLSSSYCPADGSTPITAILELRSTGGEHRADLFDASRLRPVVTIDDAPQPTPILVRHAPGVWSFTVQPASGSGGSTLTLGATFDGAPVVVPKRVPIATDIWAAEYATTVNGGCAIARAQVASEGANASVALAVAALSLTLRRRRGRACPQPLRRRV